MAEDFQAPICGDNWWSSSRNMMVTVGGLSPCSVGIGDLGWPPADDFLDIKPKSATDSDHNNNNNNSMLFQDYSTFQMMGFALSSSTTSDHWNQPDGLLCGGGRGESNFNSNGIERYKDEEIKTSFTSDSSFINGLKQGDDEDYNMLEQNGLMSINCSSTTNSPTCQGLFPLDSTLYGYPHQQQQQQPPPHAHSLFNATHPHPQPVSAALHFANNTPFWNAPTAASSTHIPQGIASLLEQKSAKPINNGNCENGQEPKKCDKNSANESAPVFKRPRIETPSPLPTFKVRKEKLGDRVTALQQLVSPFGKTDTASVLHEAIEYIKFLHDQVSVLSTPYMKSNNGITPTQQYQQVCEKEDPDCPKQDLRSRGLCLVPVSSTFPVSNVGTADFWTPTFGGTFR